MIKTEPRRSAINRPPPAVSVYELRTEDWSSPPTLLDVRSEELYRAGHVFRSLNATESNTTALMKKVGVCDRVILICQNGHLSATVARMLGVCGYPDVAYLQGGLDAWAAAGAVVMETSRTGNDVRVPQTQEPARPGFLTRVLEKLSLAR